MDERLTRTMDFHRVEEELKVVSTHLISCFSFYAKQYSKIENIKFLN